jgi:hypothetical protein
MRIWSLRVLSYWWIDLGKVPSLVFRLFFEGRSMIPRQSLHVTPLRVFVVVLRLCRNQACFSRLSVHRNVVFTLQQVLLSCWRMMALHLLQFAAGGSREFLVVFLMERGLLVRARGIHAPSSTTSCALCRPVLFCWCFGF